MADLDRRMLLGAAAGVAGVAALASRRARGGPLDPPQGPITSTGRTLVQVEPRVPLTQEHTPGDATCTFRITQGGSYCLVSDLVGESRKCAIKVELATPGVVQIDMNGFTMSRGSSEFLSAMLFAGAPCRCLTVADGYLVGWGLDCFNVDFVDLDDVTVLGGQFGLTIRRSGCLFDIEVTGCAGSGITWLRDPTATAMSLEVSDCVVRSCGEHGLSVEGDWGGATASLSITDNDFTNCGGDGVSVRVASVTGPGHLVLIGHDYCCPNCRNGVFVEAQAAQPGALGVECVVSFWDVECVGNTECGMRFTNAQIDIEDCLCSDNGTDGVSVVACRRGVVTGCSTNGNARGIAITGVDPTTPTMTLSECCDCTCEGNGVGIFADGSVTGVCFEDNSLVNNLQAGMQIDGSGNLVTCNACRGANAAIPGFLIAPGNMAGAIVSGPDALVVSDNPNLNCVLG